MYRYLLRTRNAPPSPSRPPHAHTADKNVPPRLHSYMSKNEHAHMHMALHQDTQFGVRRALSEGSLGTPSHLPGSEGGSMDDDEDDGATTTSRRRALSAQPQSSMVPQNTASDPPDQDARFSSSSIAEGPMHAQLVQGQNLTVGLPRKNETSTKDELVSPLMAASPADVLGANSSSGKEEDRNASKPRPRAHVVNIEGAISNPCSLLNHVEDWNGQVYVGTGDAAECSHVLRKIIWVLFLKNCRTPRTPQTRSRSSCCLPLRASLGESTAKQMPLALLTT